MNKLMKLVHCCWVLKNTYVFIIINVLIKIILIRNYPHKITFAEDFLDFINVGLITDIVIKLDIWYILDISSKNLHWHWTWLYRVADNMSNKNNSVLSIIKKKKNNYCLSHSLNTCLSTAYKVFVIKTLMRLIQPVIVFFLKK